ncbi:MAG TPA: DUF1501 domain-containing protein [Gemmataceae bacterium]|nr:DUF1501 domain-containing protein [Gemmataceae bacterium]
MLTLLGSPRRLCDGWTRREALRAGALSALGGLALPELFRAEAAARAGRRAGKARHVVCLYLLGGAATQDMFDLKPDAPPEVRGEFRPVATSVPGVRVCEHLPRLSRWMHRAALVRSVHHKAGCHNPLPSYTGSELLPTDIVSTRDTYPPSMGSVCEWLGRQGPDNTGRPPGLPAYVYLPCYLGWGQAIRRPGPYAGFLGKAFDPLCTECAPTLDAGRTCAPGQPQYVRGQPRLPDGALGEGMTLDRLRGRHTLLEQFDGEARRAERRAAAGDFDRQRQRAFGLLTSAAVRSAFDLGREPPAALDRYGRTLFGSSVLLARRLVEAGVRFVNVTWDIFWDRYHIDYDGWDTHTRNFSILKDWNLPQFDQAFSALLADLEARGLLDETLVVVLSEMGRTPKVNGAGGRDHWTYCYSVLLAGAGLSGGSVCGASDAQAAFVKDRPVRPADIVATVYECLGIDPDLPVYDRSGRPVPVAQGGQPIREVLA